MASTGRSRQPDGQPLPGAFQEPPIDVERHGEADASRLEQRASEDRRDLEERSEL